MDSTKPAIPGYEVLHELGHGATGTVWVVHRGDGIRLAAKVIDDDVGRVDDEIELLRSIEHDHVVSLVDVVYESGPGGRTVVVTELAAGGSLADCLTHRGHLTAGELVTVLCPVARALHDLHGMGVVHGDLSPGNILLTAAGKPLIADLGVARVAGLGGEEVWATERWAAPEVLSGQVPTGAADVYAIGAIAWAALAGAPPEPPALREPLADLVTGINPRLADLVTACLSHTASSRPSAGELAQQLWSCATPEPAPIQGSPGVRGAAPVRPETVLTRRMRRDQEHDAGSESAVADRGPLTPVEGTSPRAGRQRSRATRAGKLSRAKGSQRSRTTGVKTRARTAGTTPVPHRRAARLGQDRVATVLAVIATAAAAAVAVLAFFGWQQVDHAAAASAADRAQPSATARESTTARSPAQTLRSAQASASATPSQATGATSPVSTQEPGFDARATLQGLATARARAWSSGDPRRLTAALAPGSPAYQADSRELDTASNQGASYRGLTFTVVDARVATASASRATVRATVARSACTVVVGGQSTTVPALTEQVLVTLQKVGTEWRINRLQRAN